MSGTEAVMQAVRLARYHTGKTHLVRFCGAYHGWWDGVHADMVTYGKTLGGGLPIGVLAGTHRLMQRFKDDQPINVSFACGTFNSHPYVMGAMSSFLNRIRQAEIQQQYRDSEGLCNRRVAQFNHRLRSERLPLQITNLHSILSVLYTQPSRYNWMFQFYLREAGLELSWTATGRLIMSYSFSDAEFEDVIERFVNAAHQMQDGGWWWQSPALTNKAIKRQFLADMLTARFPALAGRIHGPLIAAGRQKIAGWAPDQDQYSSKVG